MSSIVKRYTIILLFCLLCSPNRINAGYADVWVNPVQNVIAVRTYFPAGPTWTDQTCLALYAVQGAQSFVTSAWYGTSGGSIGSGRYDVTSVLNTLISQQKGSLAIASGSTVYNALFGNPTGDATAKTLSITLANRATKTYASYPAISLDASQLSAPNYMSLQGQSLSLITVIPGDFNTAAWSSDGNYIAIGGGMNMRSGPDCGFLNKDKLRIYNFTGTSLLPMASADYPSQYDGSVLSVSWKPGSSSPYTLAVVGIVVITHNSSYFLNPGISPLETFTFTPSTPALTLQYSYPSYSTGSFYQVAWSPNGSYIGTTSYDYRTDVISGYTLILHTPIYTSGNFAYLNIHNPASATLAKVTSAGPIANVGSTVYGYQPLMAFAWSSASDRIGISLQGMSNLHSSTYIYSWNGSALAFNTGVGFNGNVITYENGGWSSHVTTNSYEYGVLNTGGQAWNGALAWNHNDSQLALYTGAYNVYGGVFTLLDYKPIRIYNYTKGSPDTLSANVSASINPATDGTVLQPVYAGTVGWGPADRFLAVGTYGALANDQSGFGMLANADMRVYGWQYTNLCPIISYGYGADGQGTITAMAWSSDGLFLAVGGTNPSETGGFTTAYQVRIYQLVNGLTLVPVTGFNYGTNVNALAWSVIDSQYYLTVGGGGPGDDGIGGFNNSDDLRMYNFDGSSVLAYSSIAFNGVINTMEWTNNQYLVVGGTSEFFVIFNVVNGALHQLVTHVLAQNATVNALSWSNWQTTGAYLVVASTYIGDIGEQPGCNIYWFNSTNSTIDFVTGYDFYATVGNVVWDKTIIVSPYNIAIALNDSGERLFALMQFDGSNLTFVQGEGGCQGSTPLVMTWGTVSGNRYLVANAQNTPYDVQLLNNSYLYYSLSYGAGLQSIAFNPIYTNFFALGGTNPTSDVIAGGFADTNELRLYSVPSTSFLPLANQTYANTINTNDVVRPESGLSLAIPNAYSLLSGEGITGAIDVANGLTSLTTTPPLPTIATTQSLHGGDLDLTQGCIQLDGSLRLGPGSNILTSSATAPLGGIYLNEQTLFLQGDTTLRTTIVANQTYIRLMSAGTVDGLDNNLSISGPVSLTTDGVVPTKFRNLTFTNLWYGYGLYDETLQGVILENVTFLTSPGQTVTLSTPSLTIQGICKVVGGGTFTLAADSYLRNVIYATTASYYGLYLHGSLDVTDTINTMIASGAKSVMASVLVFGSDPSPGDPYRVLEITFSNGQTLICEDGERIVFPQGPLELNTAPSYMNVQSALYGNPNDQTTDVTSFINSLFLQQGGTFVLTARDEVITGTMSSYTYNMNSFLPAGQHTYFWNNGWPLLGGDADTLWIKFHAVGTQDIVVALANVASIDATSKLITTTMSYLVDIGGPTGTASFIGKGNPENGYAVKKYHGNPTQVLDGDNALITPNGGDYWASFNRNTKEISWGKGTIVGLDPKQTWTDAARFSGINRVGFCGSANAMFSNISVGAGMDGSAYTYNISGEHAYFVNGGWALPGGTNDIKWVKYYAGGTNDANCCFTNRANINPSTLYMSNNNAYTFLIRGWNNTKSEIAKGSIDGSWSSVAGDSTTGGLPGYFWASVQQNGTSSVTLQWGMGTVIGQNVVQSYTDSSSPILNIDCVTLFSSGAHPFSNIQVGCGADPGKELILNFKNDTVTTLYQNQTLTLLIPSLTPPLINIASGATLYVGPGTTLNVNAINFEDSTSTLFLDGATLLNTCMTGPLHLTKGTLKYNGLVTMSSFHNSRFAIGDGTAADDLHIVGEPAATLKFDQSVTCTGESVCWYRNVH